MLTYQTSSGSGTLASEQFSYDANLRPTGTSATWQNGSGTSGTILSQSRSYDAASNVTSLSTALAAVPGVSNSGGSEVQNFCYDEQNQLVWAGNSGSQPGAGNGTCGNGTLSNSLNGAGYGSSFVYTHLGQLWQGSLNGTGTQEQYLYCDSSHPHQLTGVFQANSTCSNKQGQGYASTYDAFGKVSSRSYNTTTATLSSDGLDHLVSWDAGSSSQEQYIYDAAGQRVLRRSTVAGSTTLTVYAFGLEEHRYSGTGVNQGNTYYYSLGGRLIGESNGSSTNLFLTDGLGSVITTISATAGNASVQGNQAYGPYGNSRYQAGTMGTAKGFTGQYQDATRLDDYNARYYDPVVGRFVSADTKQGNVQGMDPYAYVQDNPETKNDPTGQIVCNAGGTCSQSPPQPPPCLTGLECAEIPFIGLRFGINYTKFWVDYLILQNKPASVADLLGLFDLKFPLYSNEDLLKALAPLLGISPHNAGRLFSSLEENAPGLLKLFEGLGHAANGIAALYDVLDIVNQLSSKNRNVTQLEADVTNLISIGLYYASKWDRIEDPEDYLVASVVFAVISFVLNVVAFSQESKENSSFSYQYRRDKRDDNNGGGGGPPFPPPFPVTAFLPPATNEQSTGSICLSVGGGFFSC